MKKLLLFLLISVFANVCFSQDAESLFKTAEQKKKIGDTRLSNNDEKGAADAYKEAIAAYTKTIGVDPKYKNAFLQRAWCYNYLKDYESVIKDYTKVIEIQHDSKYAYLSRGSAKNKLKKYKEAIEDFDKVIELDPKNHEAYCNRGEAKKGLGDNEGACADWKKAKKMGNGDAKILLENNHCR